MSETTLAIQECDERDRSQGEGQTSFQDAGGHTRGFKLSETDLGNVGRIEHLLSLMQARAMSVAQRKQVGAYICGRPGTGKTKSIKDIFDSEGIPYQYINCRVSPGGLYDAMKHNPEDVFFLDGQGGDGLLGCGSVKRGEDGFEALSLCSQRR